VIEHVEMDENSCSAVLRSLYEDSMLLSAAGCYGFACDLVADLDLWQPCFSPLTGPEMVSSSFAFSPFFD
jgi:hypothetical protein